MIYEEGLQALDKIGRRTDKIGGQGTWPNLMKHAYGWGKKDTGYENYE